MKISIQCSCGKQYQVKSELAGKKVKCQACGTPIPVPAAEPAKAENPPRKAAASAAKGKPAAAKAAPPAAPKGAPAKKPAAAAPQAASAPAAPLHNILDEAMAGAARLPVAGEMYCPKCRSIIPAASVICINCGTDVQSGRATRVSSEANRPKRKPGQMPILGIFVALVSIFYGLAGGAFFTLCIIGSFIVLAKLGLPTSENGQSATAMFGLPVHILLSVAGLLMFVSGIGIFRYSKGATLNAGLGAKIYVWTLLVLMVTSVGNVIYKNTEKAKEAAAQAESAAANKKPEEPVDLGHAQRLTAANLMGHLTMGMLATIVGIFMGLIAPPAFVWAWAATQGRVWDWELPEPVHKLKLKPTAKVGGPQATEK
jgi:hypothetical protein